MLHKAPADAVSWGYLAENPASHATPPRLARQRLSVWTTEQLGVFLHRAAEDRFYPLYLLVATTGMRRAKLCGLRWSALDLDAGHLSVEGTRVVVAGHAEDSDGKTDHASRMISLDQHTVTALRAHRQQQDEERALFGPGYPATDLVFTWEDGRPIHPDTLRQRFTRLAARTGLPRIRYHDLRHSYATAALRAGVNPKIVSHRLGHASVAFTLGVYSHVTPGLDRDAANQIADLVLGTAQQRPVE